MSAGVCLGVDALLRLPTPAAGTAPAAAPAGADAATIARLDELWKRRDDPAALAEQKALIDKTLPRAGKDYALLWRAARLYFWLSDDPDLGRGRADPPGQIRLGPGRTRGGPEPQRRRRALLGDGRHGQLRPGPGRGAGADPADRGQVHGAHQPRRGAGPRATPTAASRWPGAATTPRCPGPNTTRRRPAPTTPRRMQINPHNLRARVFLAELMLEEDQPAEAKRLLEEVLQRPGRQIRRPRGEAREDPGGARAEEGRTRTSSRRRRASAGRRAAPGGRSG